MHAENVSLSSNGTAGTNLAYKQKVLKLHSPACHAGSPCAWRDTRARPKFSSNCQLPSLQPGDLLSFSAILNETSCMLTVMLNH
ncbi:hypothetical protein HanPSC8_Chr10g0421931 [Helianthus annuus]|nr:hypothetical protein HanPSC8_Chr10g0421931 [Helianthus annuus]